MKAKFINEKLTKFTEDSDPIEDMGIGSCQKNIAALRNKLRDMFDENYSRVVEDDELVNDKYWEKIEVIQEIQETIDTLFGKEE